MNTIAATTTATGLTVTAVLDAGRYPAGAEVTDAQMKDLEDRVIARHGFHGDWNYTILPVPRPAPGPGPEPPPPQHTAPDLAVLDQPALTGLPPGGAAALAAGLAIPHAARREARLHAKRRGRSRHRAGTPRNDPRHKMTFPGYVLAAIFHQRFALPARALADLFGCDRTTIGHELPRIGQLLADTATTIPPAPRTLATYQDLRDYAATAGITLPDPARTPPARHANNPRHTPNSP